METTMHPQTKIIPVLSVGALLTLALLLGAGAASAAEVATLASPDPEPHGETVEAPLATDEDPMEALLGFAACMREQGIDMPDPQPAGDGAAMFVIGTSGDASAGLSVTRDEAFAEAEETCRSHLEAVVPSDRDPQLEAEMVDRLLVYAECMRDNGIDMPDPVVDGGNIRIGMAGNDKGLDPLSDEFQSATETCRDVSPLPGGGAWAGSAP
jgi:hypothetical protein